MADGASPELKSVRERLRRQRTRLKGTLESFLRSRDTAKYLQDQVVTDRNGRFVLVVRAEHRSAIPGIVHGSSSSGASLYLEPLSTVEINNDIVALEQQEAEEVRRILLALTDQYRRRALDLQRTIEAGTELDVIQAKARLSALVGGVEPALAGDGAFELLAARHPLLIPAVAQRLADARAASARGGEGGGGVSNAPENGPVPVDVKLIPGTTVLVVTGPNTGGKTVALKTAGLLALMAQAGLHVPAEHGSRVPVFRSVFADIGDEQSIAANLSTFSWHMANIVQMDRSLALPALVLLDEAGAGTDPVEGGALGLAIVDHLRRARRPRGRHDALRAAEVVCLDDARRRLRRVRVRSRDVRADLPAELRHAGAQPGAGNRGAAGPEPGDPRGGAPQHLGARGAARRSPGEDRRGPAQPGPRAAPGGPRARGAGRVGSAA